MVFARVVFLINRKLCLPQILLSLDKAGNFPLLLPVLKATLDPVEKALRDAKLDKSAIHELVLVEDSKVALGPD